MAQLELLNLSVHFGGVKTTRSVSIRVEQGEFRGLISPNDAGKTAVFNAIAGAVQPTIGDVYFEGQRLNGIRTNKTAHMGIARTSQNIRTYPEIAVTKNVAIGLDSYLSYNALSAVLRFPHVVKRDREVKWLGLEYLDKVGILEYKNYEAGALPYGLQRELEIARTSATKPKLLFLNEPAVGMSINESIGLVPLLKDLYQNNNGLTIVLIEHHSEVIMEVCQSIDMLGLSAMLASGVPDEIQKNPDMIKVYLGERRKRNGK